MTHKIFAAAAAYMVASTSLVFGQTIYIDEGFESYDSLTGGTNPLSDNWVNAGDQISLDSTGGNPGQALEPTDNELAPATWAGSSFDINPTATENVVFGVDFFDPGSGSIRRTATLTGAGGSGTLELGLFNLSGSNNYAIRVLGSAFYDNSSWSDFAGPSRTSGWHRFEAILSETGLTATLDIGTDGIVDSTLTFSGNPAGVGMSVVDVGPPANDATTANPLVDNVYLAYEAIPEPNAYALGFGALALSIVLFRRSLRSPHNPRENSDA